MQYTFSRYSAVAFNGTKKNQRGTADKVVNSALTSKICFYATPDILLTDKDSRFTWSKFPQFRDGRNSTYRRLFLVVFKIWALLKEGIGILKTQRNKF